MAGEQTITNRRSITIGGVTIGGVQSTVLADVANSFQKTVPGPSTNFEVDLGSIVLTNMKAIGISSNRACTVYTNAPSTGAPNETIAILANQEHIWIFGDLAANKFIATSPLTKLYITVPGTDDATVKFGCAYDGTPTG